MKKIKSFRLFESLDNDVIVIKDLLLDFRDSDIDVSVGIWRRHFSNHFHKYQGLRCVRVEIGDYVKMFTLVELGVSLLEVIEYCESQGLFLMDDSTISSPLWQKYEGCPKCLSDDLDRQTIISGEKRLQSSCRWCGYFGNSDEFLLDDWPLTEDRLNTIISEGKRISNIQLYFSEVKSVY
jgi:hypothetical protein